MIIFFWKEITKLKYFNTNSKVQILFW
jgi:hypothetical protein